MREVYNIINQIQNTSSRNEKEAILKSNSKNIQLKNLLQFVFDPFIITGLSKKKMNKNTKLQSNIELNNFEEVAEYLKKNNTGRDIDIASVHNFIDKQDNDLQEFYKQVFTKELNIGANTKTINKVFGKGFISEFNVMLAEKYWDNQDKVEGKDFIISLKLDGIRCVAFVEDSVVKMFSRQGQPHLDFNDIIDELSHFPDGVYDGELIATNPDNLNSADLYRRTMTIARKNGIKKDIVFHVFDSLSLDDFKNSKSQLNCKERKDLVKRIIEQHNTKWIEYVEPLYEGNDTKQILELLDKVISQGLEGLMVNLADALYETKRVKTLLKVKKMQSVDLKIVGFEEGDGRLKNTLGRINVMYKENLVGIGSGYTDYEREYIWSHKDELMGRIIEISYFEESTNQKTNEISLRFPIFKGLRIDKTEESYF